MNQSLILSRNIVALELSVNTPAINVLKNHVSNIILALSDKFNLFSPNDKAIQLTGKEANLIKLVRNIAYPGLMPAKAFTPEGLSSTYLDYGIVLADATTHIHDHLFATLNAFSLYLSQLITNQDFKYSTKSFLNEHRSIDKLRVDVSVNLSKQFAKGSTRTETTYGDVVARNADWQAILTTAERLTREINRINRTDLNKKVKECVTLADTLLNLIKDETLKDVSPAVVGNISEGAYLVASELEFFSVVYYKVLAYTESINKTVDHILNVYQN